ncbi:MAG: thiamine pyrophosphate-dependent enzyme [Microbacterium sp.]
MTLSILPDTDAGIPTVLAEPPLDPNRFIEPDGALTDLGRAHGIDLTLARQLYRDMAGTRRFDQEAYSLQRRGELSLYLQSIGQEAAQVGSIRALRDSDTVFPSYRERGVELVRGLTPAEMLRPWRGTRHAGWSPEPSNVRPISVVLGVQTLHAVGYALGAVAEGTDEVVCTYFGDGASSEGDVSEALNWSAASHLPMLFFVQNNQWAISTPNYLQMGSSLHRRAAGFGLRAYHVDGNDALAVHAVTTQAAVHIRAGGGPVLIEAQTYRMAGHSTSDDPKRYRQQDEVEQWHRLDPLARLRVVLEEGGTPQSWFDRLEESLDRYGQTVREACLALKAEEFDELYDLVYADPHPRLDEQRAERARFLATVAGA